MSDFSSPTFMHQNPVAFRLSAICFDGDEGRTATGSIWRADNKRFLVSNWHVFAGRSTYTGQPLSKKGDTPIAIELHYMKPWPLSQVDTQTNSIRIDLYDGAGNSLWFQHARGQIIDLALIELPHDVKIADQSILPHSLDDSAIAQLPGTDIFIMGFPKGLQKQGGHPVWKRASIASHPSILSDELPITLVDTAGREGMSGAPAFIVQYASQFIGTISNGFMNRLGQPPYRFAGIYSGRYGADDKLKDEFSAQLGRIWWEHIIDEMLKDPRPGKWELF